MKLVIFMELAQWRSIQSYVSFKDTYSYIFLMEIIQLLYICTNEKMLLVKPCKPLEAFVLYTIKYFKSMLCSP